MEINVRKANSNDEQQLLELIRLFVAEFREDPNVQLPKNAANVYQKIVNNSIPGAVFIAETEDSKSIGCATVSVQEVIFKGDHML